MFEQPTHDALERLLLHVRERADRAKGRLYAAKQGRRGYEMGHAEGYSHASDVFEHLLDQYRKTGDLPVLPSVTQQ